MSSAPATLTVPSPRPRPPMSWFLPSQSANDAPSGRVSTYAVQKSRIGLRLVRQYAIAGTAIVQANTIADDRYPQPNDRAVRSPTAVPSANVTTTASQ